MADRAEERALEAYPVKMRYVGIDSVKDGHRIDVNESMRERYIKAYHQAEKDILFNNEKYHTVQVSILDELYDIKKKYEAEKDLVLTWEDVRRIILIHERMATQAEWKYVPVEQFYSEVLKRFLERKNV